MVAAAVLLAGCTSDATTGSAPTTQPNTTQPNTTRPSTPEPLPETSPSDEEAAPCEDVMFQRVQGTIRSQQRALAAQDFQAARGYATDSFRASVSVPDFRRIIQDNYAFLLEDPALDFVECQRQGNTALIQLEVAGSPVTVMVYRVVLENESWFIDAASIAGNREDVTA